MSDWRAQGIGGVLLAAGAGRRMGGESKLLLPHPADGQPLVVHAARALIALDLPDVVAVVRAVDDPVAAALAGLPLRLVPNAAAESGQASSLQAGIAALGPEMAAALLVLGDTPAVDPAVFAALLAAYEQTGRPITQPVYGGTPGPPTLLARACWPALTTLTGDAGARQLFAAHPDWVCRVSLPASLLPLDIDTPDDYRRLTP
jgi:molybdenum cofactor cytidylyltransferase